MTRPKKPDVVHPGVEGPWAVHRPQYAAYCQHCEAAKERERRISALHRAFVEFGYSGLTLEETAHHADEDSFRWLHALTIDIPARVETALGTRP